MSDLSFLTCGLGIKRGYLHRPNSRMLQGNTDLIRDGRISDTSPDVGWRDMHALVGELNSRARLHRHSQYERTYQVNS
jgi:hypothetical protein